MIRCIHCGGKSKTIYTIQTSEGVERRRECTQCGWRFMTVERYERDIRSVKNYPAAAKRGEGHGELDS